LEEEEEEEEVNGGWWWQGVNLAWFLVFLGDGRVGRARACVSWLQAAETTGRQQRPSRLGSARLGTVPVPVSLRCPACGLRYIRVDFAGSRWAVPAGSNAAPRDWNRNPPIGSGWLALACLAVVGVGGCGLWLGLALWLASGRRAGLIVWCRAHVDGAVLSCPVAWPLDNGGYNCTFAAGRLGRPGCNCNCNCGSDT
jgi:hypothetical protein